ncbi:hypothetical protein HDG37_007946 [Paraburkholderia sp. MM5384-R2]|nr:hypothetical protein [Paraburkholderia sp. MM5384-R2]
MVQEYRGEYPSQWAAIESIAPNIGCTSQTLLGWIKREEVDSGEREGVTYVGTRTPQGTGAREQGTAPCQRDSEAGECVFRPGGARPPPEVQKAFIDQHRDTFGVEPMCKVLRIAPSGYRRHAALLRDPSRHGVRAIRDERLRPEIKRVWQANMQVYGPDKVWKQMNLERIAVARCTVERLMKPNWVCTA